MRFVIALLLVLCSSPVWAKNLYVNNSGSPACSDSTTYAANDAANPWCTIGRAMWGNALRSNASTSQAAQAGDVVIISPGTYHQTQGTGERLEPLLEPVNSGTSWNPITFKAEYPAITASVGQRTIITSETTAPHETLMGASDTDYIVFDGFYIDEANIDLRNANAPNADECWVTHATGATGITFQNFVIISRDVYALGLGYISSPNHSAVFIQGSDNITVKNNKFYGGSGVHHNVAAVMTYSAQSSIIEHNEIYDWFAGVHIKGQTTVNNCDLKIRLNLIYDVATGIEFGYHGGSCGDSYAYQNIIKNNRTSPVGAIVVRSYTAGDPVGVWAVNNTIVDFDVTGYGAIRTLAQNPGAVTVKNNIVYGCHTAVGDPEKTSLDADYIFDRNLYYDFTNVGAINGNNYTTLATWQSFSGDDANSSTSDPTLLDAVGGDYRLDTGSPALTLGRTITAIHGTNDQTIPAGAYITGNEEVGIQTGSVIYGGSQINTGATIRIGAGSTRIYPVQ